MTLLAGEVDVLFNFLVIGGDQYYFWRETKKPLSPEAI